MSVDEANAAAAEAEQAAREAEQLAAELEARLSQGDESISAEQLDEQSRLSRWARLRAEGAAKKRRQAVADAAVESAREAIEHVAQVETSDAELVAAWSEAVGAVHRLSELAAQRTELIRENQTLLEAHDAKLTRVAGTNLAAFGVLPARYGREQGYRIPARGIDVADVPAQRIVSSAIEVGVKPRIGTSELELLGNRQLVGSTLTGRIVGWDAAAREVVGQ